MAWSEWHPHREGETRRAGQGVSPSGDIPRDVWTRFFDSAEREIGILADSALFLAEDREILRLLADKGRAGVAVRISIRDPESRQHAEPGEKESIGDAALATIRSSLALYRPLSKVQSVEIRLHQIVLYSSIYRADDQLLVNQRVHGIPEAHAPVFCMRNSPSGEMGALYLGSFERVWACAVPLA